MLVNDQKKKNLPVRRTLKAVVIPNRKQVKQPNEVPVELIAHSCKAFTQKCKDGEEMILEVADCASVIA